LVCLVPGVVVGAVVGFLLWPTRHKPELDTDGGTILVYEVNLERTAQRKREPEPDAAGAGGRGLSADEMENLAEQIRRRLDLDGGKNVAARAVNDRRVEVAVPADPNTPTSHAEEIDEVMRLLSQTGVLEFRILANGMDDREAILDVQQDLAARPQAERGRADGGVPAAGRPGGYHVPIGETEAQVRYAWAEIGPQERDSLFLTDADENPSPERVEQRTKRGRGELWQALAAKRNQIVCLYGGMPTDDEVRATMVLFSRARDRVGGLPKSVEYFVLTRVSPLDSLRVGEGNVNLDANVGLDLNDNPAVNFTLTGEGPQRFGALTRRNRPSNNHERQLAILLDGRVVSSASIKSEIGSHGQITGSFDRRYVDQIVQTLNSGALSAELKALPVYMQEVAPTKVRKAPPGKTTALGLAIGAAVLTQLVCLIVYWRLTSGGSATAAGAAPPPGAKG
jgi:preprotein translocase subunit SecD